MVGAPHRRQSRRHDYQARAAYDRQLHEPDDWRHRVVEIFPDDDHEKPDELRYYYHDFAAIFARRESRPSPKLLRESRTNEASSSPICRARADCLRPCIPLLSSDDSEFPLMMRGARPGRKRNTSANASGRVSDFMLSFLALLRRGARRSRRRRHRYFTASRPEAPMSYFSREDDTFSTRSRIICELRARRLIFMQNAFSRGAICQARKARNRVSHPAFTS